MEQPLKSAAFIPIKLHSERVPHKNFRLWRGRPLFQWIIDHALEAGCFSQVYVDTDSIDVAEYAMKDGAVSVIRRLPELASNDANGNDLLWHHAQLHPDYDAYFQLFATAPELKPETIAACVDAMTCEYGRRQHDSILTARQEKGWFWLDPQHPLYRPGILPRSQDWPGLWKESTGLYGIFRDTLMRYGCRIGANPMFYPIAREEMVDIDEPHDLEQNVAV